MQKAVTIFFGLILLFFMMFMLLVQITETPPNDSAEFVNDGSCISKKNEAVSLCLKTKDIYFITEKLATIESGQVANSCINWFKDINLSVNKDKFLVLPSPPAEGHKPLYHIFATQNLTANSSLFEIKFIDTFNRDALGPKYFTPEYPIDQLNQDVASFLKLKISSNFNKLIVVLLYHMFHLEHSKYRPWLNTLPAEINTFGHRMTLHELNLLKDDPAYEFAKVFIDVSKKEFQLLKKEMQTKLTKEQLRHFLNGHELRESDYMYARHVSESGGWSLNEKSDEIIIFPPTNLLSKRTKLMNEFLGIETQKQEGTGQEQIFTMVLDRDIKSYEEVVESYRYHLSYQNMIILGVVPENDISDCVDVELFTQETYDRVSQTKKELLQHLGQNGIACVPNNQYGLMRIIFLGNVYHMSENQAVECLQLIENAEKGELGAQISAMKQCHQSVWSKFDARQVAYKSMEKNMRHFEKQLKSAQEYQKMRQHKGLDSRNADLLVTYFSEKVNIIVGLKKLMEQIKFRDINALQQESTFQGLIEEGNEEVVDGKVQFTSDTEPEQVNKQKIEVISQSFTQDL